MQELKKEKGKRSKEKKDQIIILLTLFCGEQSIPNQNDLLWMMGWIVFRMFMGRYNIEKLK